MYSETDLEAAVEGGVLTAEQAASFRDFVASTRQMPAADEEHFRLLTGFNDIFVGIAATILLIAVGWIGQFAGPKIDYAGPSPLGPLLVAGTAWGLAEFFTLKRRMALPSIILLLAFAAGTFFATWFASVLIVGERNVTPQGMFTLVAIAAAIACGATWAHWRRFKVPITVAVGAAALAALVVTLVASLLVGSDPDRLAHEESRRIQTMIEGTVLLLGLGTFVVAMRWDASDRRRETRRSDVAFWLHLLAAPMIVHPVFSLLGLTTGQASIGAAMVVVLLYVALAVVALAIDRRALLVSALAYVLWAINALFQQSGAVELSVALTALVIGSALLLLSAFWPNARRAVVRPLPESLQARLPLLDRPATRVVPA
jgi:MFS family permease